MDRQGQIPAANSRIALVYFCFDLQGVQNSKVDKCRSNPKKPEETDAGIGLKNPGANVSGVFFLFLGYLSLGVNVLHQMLFSLSDREESCRSTYIHVRFSLIM